MIKLKNKPYGPTAWMRWNWISVKVTLRPRCVAAKKRKRVNINDGRRRQPETSTAARNPTPKTRFHISSNYPQLQHGWTVRLWFGVHPCTEKLYKHTLFWLLISCCAYSKRMSVCCCGCCPPSAACRYRYAMHVFMCCIIIFFQPQSVCPFIRLRSLIESSMDISLFCNSKRSVASILLIDNSLGLLT